MVYRFGVVHNSQSGFYTESFQWPAHLSEGIYYLTLQSEDNLQAIKIVKSK